MLPEIYGTAVLLLDLTFLVLDILRGALDRKAVALNTVVYRSVRVLTSAISMPGLCRV